MVKKGHKYVTLLQMILYQKLGKFVWQGDIYLTMRDIYLRLGVIYLTGRDIKLLGGQNVYHVYYPLSLKTLMQA